MSGVIAIAVICVIFGGLALIVAAVERLPHFPPMYDDSDVLPPPNVRAQRSGRESH